MVRYNKMTKEDSCFPDVRKSISNDEVQFDTKERKDEYIKNMSVSYDDDINSNRAINEHVFQKLVDKTKNKELNVGIVCRFCRNLWPSSSHSTTLNFYKCKICELYSCGACRLLIHSDTSPCLAEKIYSDGGEANVDSANDCNNEESDEKGSIKINLKKLNLSVSCISVPKTVLTGKLYIRLLHAYDLDSSTGASIYGIIKSRYETIETKTTEYNSNECQWSTSQNTEQNINIFINYNSDEVSYMLDHDDFLVSVELWYGGLIGIFDSMAALTEFSLIPVLLNPRISMERWFPMTTANEATDNNAKKYYAIIIFLDLLFFGLRWMKHYERMSR